MMNLWCQIHGLTPWTVIFQDKPENSWEHPVDSQEIIPPLSGLTLVYHPLLVNHLGFQVSLPPFNNKPKNQSNHRKSPAAPATDKPWKMTGFLHLLNLVPCILIVIIWCLPAKDQIGRQDTVQAKLILTCKYMISPFAECADVENHPSGFAFMKPIFGDLGLRSRCLLSRWKIHVPCRPRMRSPGLPSCKSTIWIHFKAQLLDGVPFFQQESQGSVNQNWSFHHGCFGLASVVMFAIWKLEYPL